MSLAQQLDRWRTGKHVGNARPVLKAWIRRGHLARHYQNLPDEDVYAYMPGMKGPNAVWYGEWVPDEDYVEVPNILDCTGDVDFEQNGVEQITMTIDNIAMREQTGTAGVYHAIKRGYYAPLRGSSGYRGTKVGTRNEWHDIFKDKSSQIMICAGYGEAFFPVFLGLLDDVDLNSRPDTITMTARNMGVFLTDQKVFGDAKNIWVNDPITFCDRKRADDLTNVAGAITAKDSAAGHPARLATDSKDDSDESAWVSGAYGSTNGMTYLDLTLPAGLYRDFEIYAGYSGLQMFISVHATNANVPGGGPARHSDGTVYGEGWINNGSGNVEGIPYTGRAGVVKEKVARYNLAAPHGGGFLLGDNSRLRLWFTNLQHVNVPPSKAKSYHAAVRDIKVYHRVRKDEAIKNRWILVDDVSDIVKVVLQWAGLTDWEVESVGIRLTDKLVFDRQAFLIDIIKKMAELTSYVFYVKPPDDFDQDNLGKNNPDNKSMGVAVFRQNNAMKSRPLNKVYSVKDSDLLTSIQAKFSNEPLAQSIRVRGRSVHKSKTHGLQDRNVIAHPLGADRTNRIQYSYRPTWARASSARFASLRKPVVHYDEQIDTVYQAKVACLYIAFAEALEAAKGQVEFPFFPPIFLDHQLIVYDEGTGLSTRVWVASRGWRFRSGEETEFSMNVAGSLIDSDDVQDTRAELQRLLAHHSFNPYPIPRGPWTEIHKF